MPSIAVWALCGLAWAAVMRGWLLQLTGQESQVTWLGTFGGVLLPGVLLGGLLGWAEHGRTAGRTPRGRRGVPALVRTRHSRLAAVLVLTFALAVLSWLTARAAPDQAPPVSVWAATTLSAYVLVLVVGCAAPQRQLGARLGGWSLPLLGALGGLAWGCGLRVFMTQVAGDQAAMTWTGTFGWIIAPAVVAGAALGWAEHLRRTGGRPGGRWLALAPLTFAALLLSEPTRPLAIFEDGIGGGAIGVPLMGMAGGYALCGRGPRVTRGVCGLVALAAVPIWATTATSVGGAALGVDTAHGLWVALLFWSLMAVLSAAASIPHRTPLPSQPHPTEDTSARDDSEPSSSLATHPAAGPRAGGGSGPAGDDAPPRAADQGPDSVGRGRGSGVDRHGNSIREPVPSNRDDPGAGPP